MAKAQDQLRAVSGLDIRKADLERRDYPIATTSQHYKCNTEFASQYTRR